MSRSRWICVAADTFWCSNESRRVGTCRRRMPTTPSWCCPRCFCCCSQNYYNYIMPSVAAASFEFWRAAAAIFHLRFSSRSCFKICTVSLLRRRSLVNLRRWIVDLVQPLSKLSILVVVDGDHATWIASSHRPSSLQMLRLVISRLDCLWYMCARCRLS